MAKISVLDAAKKVKMDPAEFIKKLKEFGINADDEHSKFDASKLEQVKALLKSGDKPAEAMVEKRISSGVVRRRRKPKKVEPKPVEEAKPEVVAEPVATEPAPEEKPAAQEKPPVSEPEVAEEKPSEPEVQVEEPETAVDEPEKVEAAPEAEVVQETEPEVESQPSESDEVISEPEPTTEETPVEAKEEPVVDKEPATEQVAVEEPSKPEAEAKQVEKAEVPKETEPAEETAEQKPAKVKKKDKKKGKGKKEQKAETGKKGKKKSEKNRKLPIRGVTREPARIVALPEKKVDTLKPNLNLDEMLAEKQREKKVQEEPDKFKRGKRGRRVVEVNRRGPGKKGRKKSVYQGDLRGKGRRKKREQKSTEITTPKAIKRKLKMMEEIQVGELAHRMGIKAGEIIKKLMGLGVMATINQMIDFDTATILAQDYGFEIENVSVDEDDFLKLTEDKDKQGEEKSRPPIVTVMGHVDHGKTTLLDAIRQTHVARGEAGGITQHIGAYNVELDKGRVAFLDTPGHETFTSMRARGAHVTDIVILIVAADDGVMPQTIEAINHAKDAEVPIIVAVNKIDKPNADPDRIKQMLSDRGLVPEEWGGDTMFTNISAKKQIGIQELLEGVLLQAEMMELTAVYDKPASGFILEARLDKGRGPVATALVREGSLKVGDPVVCDQFWGRVRTMTDDKGNRVDLATPGMPVEIIGLGGVPQAGSTFNVTKEERFAKQVAELRSKKEKEKELRKLSKASLEDLYSRIQEGTTKELKLIVKADVQGSVEAISESVRKISTNDVKVNVIHTGAGAISETDVNFAVASDAIVIGFNVRPEPKARALAEQEKIDVRLYNVIYDVVQDIRDALEGLLEPTYEEEVLGRAEVRDIFHISRIGTIAGSYVQEGKLTRNALCRLIRDGVVIYTGKLSSLRRFKDDAKEVASGFECGIGLENFNDIKIGDIVEAYKINEIAGKLD